MARRHQRSVWFAFLSVLIVLTAACSLGDDDDSPTPTPPLTQSAAESDPTATSAPTATPPQSIPTPTATAPATATATATEEASSGAWSEKILGLAAVKPENIELFTSDYSLPGIYPEASEMRPATGPAKTEEQIRAELEAFMRDDPRVDQALFDETMALFDEQGIVERVPDPNLRAGFVLLNITIARPVIEYFLYTGPFTGPLEWGETGLDFTEASSTWPDGTRKLALNQRYRYEHFGLIAANIPMSALHHDSLFTKGEDALVIGIGTMTHMQILAGHPELAHEGTELARILNSYCLPLLNSHKPGSARMEFVAPSGTGVLPGSPFDAPDFWTFMGGEGISAAPPVFGEILQGILDEDADLSIATYYSIDTAILIGDHLTDEWLSPEERVRVAVTLQTISAAEIAEVVDSDEVTVIQTFGLEPVIAAMEQAHAKAP